MILNIFFSIKLIRQFRGAKKIFRGANYRKYYRKILFFKIQRGAAAPLAKCASARGLNYHRVYGRLLPLKLWQQIKIPAVIK
jgi:hypothetical protein